MPLTRLDIEALSQVNPTPIQWIAQDLVAQGRVTMLYGDGGLGKSMVAMAAAVAITDGVPFLGRSTRRRKVLMIDSENGEQLLHNRIHQLGLTHNAEAYDATGFDLMHNTAELAHVIGEEQPGICILDSLRTLAPSMDENDSASTAVALKGVTQIAREYDTAMLVLHHAGKGGGFRGSGALRDQVDVMLEMGRDDKDPKRDRRYIRWSKNRLGAEQRAIWLRILSNWDDIEIVESVPPWDDVDAR